MSEQYVDRFPEAAAVVRAALTSCYVALGIGGLLGLVQALHRTGYFRGFVSSQEYYTVLTAHGVLLALVFTTFFLVGLFTWAVTDSLDRQLPNPRLTWTWYGLMTAGSLAAFVTILGGFSLVQDSLPIPDDLTADVLFTFYAPLEAHPLFYVGLAVFIVGTWIAGVDWFRTWWAWRADNPDERTPLRTFMVLTTMIMWYLSSIGVAVSVLGFLLPWSLGIVDSVNALLTRTLFWYFGHAVVYFWLMPAYLLWYTVLPKLAGGRLFSDPLARVVFVLFLLLSTPTGIHHQYLDPGIAEGFKFIAMTNTMFLLLPSFLTAFTVVASMEYGARKRGGEGFFGWLGDLPWRDPAFAGMALAGLMFAAGGFSGMVNAGMNVNYLVHNTLWLPGHFHLTVGTAVALTFMAAAYWLVPQLTGKPLWGRTVGLVQVVVWFVGMTLMSNAMHRAGLLGVPRRTAEPIYQSFEYQSSVGSIGELQAQIALGGTLLFVSLVLFFAVLIGTLLGRATGAPLVDGTLPPAISGPDDAPTVLDNLALWTAIAVVLVVLAYALPLASIASDGGLFGPGVEGVRAQLELVLEVTS
jgi:cytochrome c oxidase subunit 1